MEKFNDFVKKMLDCDMDTFGKKYLPLFKKPTQHVKPHPLVAVAAFVLSLCFLSAGIYFLTTETKSTIQQGALKLAVVEKKDKSEDNLVFSCMKGKDGKCLGAECQNDFVCNDGNPSTVDKCKNYVCVYGKPAVTIADNPIIGCFFDHDCDDGNPCTLNKCEENTCHHASLEGKVCTDYDLGTDNDTCSQGLCIGEIIPAEQIASK
jgi:hypothetical protein